MLLDIGTEEIAHVEMLTSMVGQLLEQAPVKAQDEAATASPVVEAALGDSNVQNVTFAAMSPQPEVGSGRVGAPPPRIAWAAPGAEPTSPPATTCWLTFAST